MTYGLLAFPLTITDEEGLWELSSLLHDETCGVDEIIHDPTARALILPVRRQFHGGNETVVSYLPKLLEQ